MLSLNMCPSLTWEYIYILDHLPVQQQMYCIFQVTVVFQLASFDEEFDPEGSKAV